MKTFSKYLLEAKTFGYPKRLPNAPMQFPDFEGKSILIAKKLNCGFDAYPKDERLSVQQQRARYLKIIWNSCLMELKPNGFDAKRVNDTIYGNTRPFYADEIRVEEWSPMKWRQAVCDWLISQFCKNEKKWMASRFDIEEKNGKKYVKSKW